MSPTLRNFIAVIGGIIVCMSVNMGISTLSLIIISPPEGVDPSDFESLKANIHLFQAKHWIMPFLAHAFGSLAGGFFAAKVGASKNLILAMVVVLFHMAGGIFMVTILSAPMWFNAADLLLAYIPMGYLGWKLAGGK